MNVRVEGLFHLASRSGELNVSSSSGESYGTKSMRFPPRPNDLEIAIRRTEASAKLIRSKPLVVIRRVSHLLLVEQLAQISFLFRAAFQHQKHSFHRQIRSCCP